MKHVLVIRLSALGDVAIMVPVLEKYAADNREMTFTVAAPPMLAPLFGGIPNVHFVGLKKKQSFWKIYKALEAVGADTVLDLHHVNRVNRALWVMRLRHLFSPGFHIYSLRKGRLSRWLFLHHWRRKPRKTQYERYDDVFRRAGLKNTQSRNHATLNSRNHTIKQSHNHTIIGVAPFSQHVGKMWPWEQVEQLVRMLSDKGYRVVLFGSKEEAPRLESLASTQAILPDRQGAALSTAEINQLAKNQSCLSVSERPATNVEQSNQAIVTSVAGKQSFAEELEIIKGLSLMVSMDSANMHFASALGIPVVSIWGATHPDFGFYGYGQNRDNALCANLPCQPCSAFGQKACRYGDYRCLRAITPEMVLNKILTQSSNHAILKPVPDVKVEIDAGGQ